MPKWLSDCDPPFYASHLLKTTGGARLRVAVFVGGTLQEEESTYIPATEGTTSCRVLNRAAAITIKRPTSSAAGIYADLFALVNDRNEVVYLLEESRGMVAKINAGQLLFSRTLYRVTDKGFVRIRPAVQKQASPAADIEQLIPLASLLP